MKQQAEAICERIERTLDGRHLDIMHVCGTHEATRSEHGLRSMLPDNLRLVMGPGCPVCITPQGDIDAFIQLSRTPGVTVATYGDLLKVPGSETSLIDAGGKYKVVLSPHQAEGYAIDHPDEKVVFLSIGFETTAPASAAVIVKEPPENLLFYSAHRLIPPALTWLLASGDVNVDGFLLPGHVCTIIGAKPFETVPVSQVVSGFEPLDMLIAILALAEMVVRGETGVVNAYPQAVKPDGNPNAVKILNEVFEPRDAYWRSFPEIPGSGLKIRKKFELYDVRQHFDLPDETGDTSETGCRCGEILRGIAQPSDCPLHGGACTPHHPVGPCMVGMEGACKIWYRYGSR